MPAPFSTPVHATRELVSRNTITIRENCTRRIYNEYFMACVRRPAKAYVRDRRRY